MSFTYPQFGNPDYSGFTTEEELARRYIATSPRGSPTIGAQMYVQPPMPEGTQSSGRDERDVAERAPGAPNSDPARNTAGSRIDTDNQTMTVSDAVMQIFRSRPVSAFDWILVFVLIIAVICFFEYSGDLLDNFRHSPHGRGASHLPFPVVGGNFCATCGGTV